MIVPQHNMKKNNPYDAASRERRLRQSENKLRAHMGKFVISKRHEKRKQEEGMFSLRNLLSQSSARSEGVQQGHQQGYDDAIKQHAPEVALKLQEVRDKAEQDKQAAIKAAEDKAKLDHSNRTMQNSKLAEGAARVEIINDGNKTMLEEDFNTRYKTKDQQLANDVCAITLYDKDNKVIGKHNSTRWHLWKNLRNAESFAADKIVVTIPGETNNIVLKSLKAKRTKTLGQFVDAEPGRVVVHKPPATPTKSVKIEEITTPEPQKAKTPPQKRREKTPDKPKRSPSPPPTKSYENKEHPELTAGKVAKDLAITTGIIGFEALKYATNKVAENAARYYQHLKNPTVTATNTGPLKITDSVAETRNFVDEFKNVKIPEDMVESVTHTVDDIKKVLKPTDEVIVTQNNTYFPASVEDLTDTIRVITSLEPTADIVITHKGSSLSKTIAGSPKKETTSTQTPSDDKTKGNDSDDAENNKPDDQINPLGLKPKELIKVIADRNSKDFGQVFRSLSGSEPIGEKMAHDYLNSLRTRGVQIQWVDDKGTRHRVPKEYTGHPLRYVMQNKNVQRIVLHTKNGEVDLTKVANAPNQHDD